MSFYLSKTQLINLWEKIHLTHEVPENLAIHSDIINSWKRCDNYKIDKLMESSTSKLPPRELKKAVQANKELLEVALPQMEILYSITKLAGFCLNIANPDGIILNQIGGKPELRFFGYANFKEGYDWSEKAMGTNAISLALALNKPIQVYGYEHYCKCACLSTCSASPIHDDKGNIIAVLDLTGPYDKVNHHTLGMVMSAAFSIETILVLKKLYKELQTSHALKSAIVESVSEGMIAVNAEQEITLINPRACKLLNMNNNCMGKKINEVLLKNNDSFLNRLKSSTQLYGETLNIKTSKGEKKFITNFNPILINNTANGEVVTFNEVNQVINRIVGARSNITFDDLIGISPIFQEAVSQAKIAAENNSNVLLLGESGVGKDLFAQAIHNASMRQNEPFLAINCAAIPRELIASELFGYSEGAFTGAKKGGKPGVFELADQGTVFLDEIGEMPADLQASLLRVLEEKSVFRLGGNEFIPVNVRLISATNKNLPEEIKNGNFRQDIFYRLSVMSIHLPPLRERIEDIPLLAEYLAQNIAKRFGKVINKIDPEVIEKLIQYQWPGNIRELSNFMERAVNFTKNGVITLDLFPKSIFITNKSTEPEYENRNYYLVAQSDVTKDVMESELIRSYMIKYSKNKSLVAKAMNISRSSLYRKIVKYGL